jgi:hypothetical protein
MRIGTAKKKLEQNHKTTGQKPKIQQWFKLSPKALLE